MPTLNVFVNNVTYGPAYKVLFVDLAPLEAFNLYRSVHQASLRLMHGSL